MNKKEYRGLNLDKIIDKPYTVISTEEALKDVIRIDWGIEENDSLDKKL